VTLVCGVTCLRLLHHFLKSEARRNNKCSASKPKVLQQQFNPLCATEELLAAIFIEQQFRDDFAPQRFSLSRPGS